MDFSDVEMIILRAGRAVVSKTKLALASLVIVLCGLLVVFCHSIGLYAGAWAAFSLNFLPLFISGGLFLGLGVVLIRSYAQKIEHNEGDWVKLLHAALSSAYVFMPIVLIFLSIWAALGLFYLLQEIPGLGQFFASIFSTGPFILHLGALLLCAFSIYLLFVLTPLFAIKNFFEASLVSQKAKELVSNLFLRLFLLFLALVPLALSALFLTLAANMTTQGFITSSSYLQMVVQWIMIMLPYAILLSPSVVFFFNVAAETHELVHKNS